MGARMEGLESPHCPTIWPRPIVSPPAPGTVASRVALETLLVV